MEVYVSASTNPPKTDEEMLKYIKDLDINGSDYIHCDVMDGYFVPSKTFDYHMLSRIREVTNKPLDVHLMVDKPNVSKYIKAGANIVTVHYEVYKNKKALIKTLLKIKKMGAFAGLSFKPTTPVSDILPYLSYCDLLLVMSVEPGKSGQTFIETTYDRLDEINSYLQEQSIDIVLEVDGGVNDKIAPKLVKKNVSMLVFGNYLYSADNLELAIQKIKQLSGK